MEDEIPFDVPEGWAWCRLRNLGEYKKGPFGSSLTKAMFVPKSDNSIKVYEQKNAIQKNHTLGTYYIKKEYFESDMKSFEVFPDDILVSCAGTIGETYILPKNIEKGIINQALMKMTLTSFIDKQYFLFYFDFILKEESKKASKGTAIKNIPPFDIFKNYLFPLPPLAEQKAIVAKIEEIFAQIDILENNKTDLQTAIKHAKTKILDLAIHGRLIPQDPSDEPASKLLEKIRSESKNATDNRRYGKLEDVPFELPDSWEWCKLGEIAERIIGKTPARGKSEYWNDAKYNWVSISDMVLYKGVSKTKEKISQKAANEVFNEISPKGSLLMSFKLTVGRTCILDLPAYHNEAIITIKPYYDVNYSFRNYLLYILPIFANLGNSHDAVKGKTLNKDSIYNIFLPMPPLAEQKRIVEKIESLFLLLDKISEELN